MMSLLLTTFKITWEDFFKRIDLCIATVTHEELGLPSSLIPFLHHCECLLDGFLVFTLCDKGGHSHIAHICWDDEEGKGQSEW